MRLEILHNKDKKKILEKLKEQYGIEELFYLLIKAGRERIRGYSGSLSKEEIMLLARKLNIEAIGLYLMKEEGDKGDIRLSFDAPSVLDIKKGIIEINNQQKEEWLKGQDIFIEDKNIGGGVVLRYENNFLGSGKAGEGRVTNFVPKERRIKN